MKKKALLFLVGLLIGASLAACARSRSIEHYDRGNMFRQQGQLDLAIEEYTEAIALFPQAVEPYNNRGLTYRIKGDLDRAIADYDQAIAFDPQNVLAYFGRGLIYAKTGKLVEAVSDLERAIDLGLDAENKQVAEETLDGLRQ